METTQTQHISKSLKSTKTSKTFIQKAFQYIQQQIRKRKPHYGSCFIIFNAHNDLEFLKEDEIRVLIEEYLKPRYEDVYYYGLERFLPPNATKLYHNKDDIYVGNLLVIRWRIEHAYKRIQQSIQMNRQDGLNHTRVELDSYYEIQILTSEQIDRLVQKLKAEYTFVQFQNNYFEIET